VWRDISPQVSDSIWVEKGQYLDDTSFCFYVNIINGNQITGYRIPSYIRFNIVIRSILKCNGINVALKTEIRMPSRAGSFIRQHVETGFRDHPPSYPKSAEILLLNKIAVKMSILGLCEALPPLLSCNLLTIFA
jgi:hypothetical protein